jgi:hypothetical protein
MKTKSTGENMRYKMICLLGLVLAGLSLSGCVSQVTRLDNLSSVSSEEAIFVAKFRVTYNGEEMKVCNMLFDEAKTQCFLDGNNYVFAKLPIGRHSISHIIHKSGLMQHHFKPEELTFQLSGGGAINYIGDITIDWHGMGSGSGVAVVAATGVIGSGLLTGGEIAVSVDSNTAEAQEAFRRKFSTDRSLTPSLLVVKPRQ